jgi:hypothetical protein
MGEKRAYKPRKPGGGRKKLKPEYDAEKNLKEQMDAHADQSATSEILVSLHQFLAACVARFDIGIRG